MVGISPEEVVLFAVALDLESNAIKSPLFQDGSIEVGIAVSNTEYAEVIRILVVTDEEQSNAQ